GPRTFTAPHVYAAEGNFTATVQVVASSGGMTSGTLTVPVLPADIGPVVVVTALPGQTATASGADPVTGFAASLTLVMAPTDPGPGELLLAELLNATLPL